MKNDICPECDRTNGEHEEWCSIGRNWTPEWMNPRDLEADGTPRDYRDPQEKP
jgi:hypothetical protein